LKAEVNFLSEIIERKRVRLEEARLGLPLGEMRARACAARREAEPHALRHAIEREGRINIIAEFKRASPSKGLIRAGRAPDEIATAYDEGGAVAISVLTEEDRFQGSLDDLRAARSAVALPLLRKDFIFDEYQLYEAAESGADALLLIVAALNDAALLARLREITEEELGMDALVEAHTAEELSRALACGATLVGINNRNLQTFAVSLDVSVELAREIPPHVLAVSESGLRSPEDLRRLRALGYRGFLIGEELMRAERPAEALSALIRAAEG
jgi:indole-3-glycerol phosphate synthase